MAQITITEALAEIKTIEKRIEKKRQAVIGNIARDSRLKDPLADAEGMTSEKFIAQERQAIEDLETRIVTLRSAIQRKNFETPCKVGDESKTIQEWLNFRRDVADKRRLFLMTITSSLRSLREQAQAKGARVTGVGISSQAIVQAGDKPPVELILHLDEKKLIEATEEHEQTMGELDGKLSLLNATTVIDV